MIECKHMQRIRAALQAGQGVMLDISIMRTRFTSSRFRARVLGDYNGFILLQGPSYKECVSHDAFALKEAKLHGLTIQPKGWRAA